MSKLGRLGKLSGRWFLFFGLSLVRVGALGEEPLGRIELRELVLRPYFRLAKPSNTEFSLGESSITFEWKRDDVFSSSIMIGQRNLIGRPLYYSPPATDNTEDLTFVEAYAQAKGEYGRGRIGIIPLDYGAEGRMRESEMIFPRSLIFKRGLVGLRDLGASYAVDVNGFFTRLAIHHGEGARNLDGRMWLTSAWGWSDEKYIEVGMMGTTGSTGPSSTGPTPTTASTMKIGNYNPMESAKWTMVGVFVKWQPRYWRVLSDWTFGEVRQDSKKNFYAGHIDVIYEFSPLFSLLARYDDFNPHTDPGDHTQEISAGIGYRTEHETASVFLIATRTFEPQGLNGSEIRLILRLTPLPAPTMF